MTGRVLIVDDKPDVLTALQILLEDHVEEILTATHPRIIPALFEDATFDVVILDMNFTADAQSGREGLQWLRNLRRIAPSVPVVLITAYGSVETAVRAMKAGAEDVMTKPWDDARVVETVTQAVTLHRTRQEADARDRAAAEANGTGAVGTAPGAGPAGTGEQPMLGESPAMREVFALIDKVAATDVNVLILGENGTGKELVARALHRQSDRADGPFVSADLGAVPPSLFESELFGHVEGAFTGANEDRTGRFEAASGGTLFLDEIGNVPPVLQAKLLTALQRRTVVPVGETTPTPIDVRLVTATNQPIYDMIDAGTFRQDLLYRINTVEITLPPLRDRGGDVLLLARHFASAFARRYDTPVRGLTPDAERELLGYGWPGNVRELRHTIERAVILTEADVLDADDFVLSAAGTAASDPADEQLAVSSLQLDDIEQAAVRKALSLHAGNVTQAAEELGISRKALYRRIEKYGL